MKKIGIITFHASQNYGSVLQAYALQYRLSTMGENKCEIINFSTASQKEMYTLFYKNSSIKNIIKNIRVLVFYRILNNRYQKFIKFKNNILPLTDSEYSLTPELGALDDKYDILICGSDQIWNIDVADFDYAYFLPFGGGALKVAYAPSLGGGNPLVVIDKKDNIKKLLKNFDFLSVREELGAKIIGELTNKKVKVVVDPTLLLGKDEWDIIASGRIINKEYIFFYSIDYNEDVVKIVKYISKKYGLSVVILYTTRDFYRVFYKGFIISKEEGPCDFISLIKYAKLVLTNSFHGTAFSIIYNKPFYVIRGTYDGKINADNRMTTILNKLNIEDREINITNYKDKEISFSLNYIKINKLLDKYKKESINYIENFLYEKIEMKDNLCYNSKNL